jgi:uncharacterized protein with GYD domain
MPIHVGLGNWTDQGTKDLHGAVQRGNAFRTTTEPANGHQRSARQAHSVLSPTSPDRLPAG